MPDGRSALWAALVKHEAAMPAIDPSAGSTPGIVRMMTSTPTDDGRRV
jgi:hypothetical protein